MGSPKLPLEAETEERPQELEKLRSAIDFLDRLLNEIKDVILLINPQNFEIVTFNQSALDNLELSEAELLGTSCHKLFYGWDTKCRIPYHTCPVKQVLETKKHVLTEYRYTTPSKKLKYFEVLVNLIPGTVDDQPRIAYVLRDITHRKDKGGMGSENICKDSLTDLYNRTFFRLKLEDELSRSKRYKRPLSLLVLEIDNLKAFNALRLVEQNNFFEIIGETINASARDIDSGYNYGDNKFYIIMPETDEPNALVFAGRLRQAFKSRILGMEMRKESVFFSWTISMGIAGLKQDDSPDILTAKSLSALQKAKQKGGDKICLFNPKNSGLVHSEPASN